jgi:hypothetical protein
VILGEGWDQETKLAGVADAAMDQEHRVALAVNRIIHLDVVDRRHAVLARRGHGGRLRQGLPDLLGASSGREQQACGEADQNPHHCYSSFEISWPPLKPAGLDRDPGWPACQ